MISDHDEDDVVGIATRAELEALAATAPGLDRVPEPLRPLALQMARAGVVNALRAGDPQMRAALRAHRARRAVQAQGSETPQPPAQPSTSPTTSRAPAPTSPSPEADAPPEREPPEPAPPPATPRRRRRIRFPFRDDHDTPPAA